MNITKALLADYANVSVEGKLNVLGIFTAIGALNFPATHPQMHLVFMWEASPIEVGKRKKIQMTLSDGDGNKLLVIGGEMVIPKGTPGQQIHGNQIIALPNIRFEKPGLYVFHISVNEDPKAEAPFLVNSIPSSKKGVKSS